MNLPTGCSCSWILTGKQKQLATDNTVQYVAKCVWRKRRVQAVKTVVVKSASLRTEGIKSRTMFRIKHFEGGKFKLEREGGPRWKVEE